MKGAWHEQRKESDRPESTFCRTSGKTPLGSSKIRIPEQQIADDLASGAPQNKDGTISLVAYAAWMLKEMSRGE